MFDAQNSSSISRAGAAIASYFTSRLAGTAPLAIVFWRDMVAIGSGLVLLSLALVVVLALNNAPTAWIVIAYVANWPYCVFATFAVWKASLQSSPVQRGLARLAALAWLLFALVV
ncbi:hypothetical protein [Devosia nitrariae]|uniref:Uncharacterized protein n=1 Tax=Devosia nitrariae TaxID=2071872 RepID=A0ABQ5WAX8_9HYPH|nr:hypothetical protein [Devosia nitrariae]GLQ57216.1 hypothetical protein GCM10010862_44750 [Devosia nitrariae]